MIVGPDRVEFGSISGRLDSVNTHGNRRFFYLYVEGQERIRCYFASDLTSKVGEAIHRYVTISGQLRFKAMTLQPYSVNAAAIDIHEQDANLPSLRDLRGIAPGATGEHSSDEFVQGLRDGWCARS